MARRFGAPHATQPVPVIPVCDARRMAKAAAQALAQ